MIPPLHFTSVDFVGTGDHSLRERPLMEAAALGSADATRCGHGLRRPPAAPMSRDIGCAAAGQPEAHRLAVAASHDSCQLFPGMVPSLPDRLGAGE